VGPKVRKKAHRQLRNVKLDPNRKSQLPTTVPVAPKVGQKAAEPAAKRMLLTIASVDLVRLTPKFFRV